MTAFIHPTAVIDEGSSLGEGSKIWHFCHIMPQSQVGKNCSLGQNCVVMNHVTIGDGCKIQNNVSLYTGVVLEDEVFVGPSAVFTNIITPRAHVIRKSQYVKTIVKSRASIGANATIVCGITIGEYALIGAGSVVTKDVLPYALIVGNPAKQIGWVCQCGFPLKNPKICPDCGLAYESNGSEPGLVPIGK